MCSWIALSSVLIFPGNILVRPACFLLSNQQFYSFQNSLCLLCNFLFQFGDQNQFLILFLTVLSNHPPPLQLPLLLGKKKWTVLAIKVNTYSAYVL